MASVNFWRNSSSSVSPMMSGGAMRMLESFGALMMRPFANAAAERVPATG